MSFIKLFICFLFVLLMSCGPNEPYTFKLPANAKVILTNDSSKTWILASRYNNKTRMNMGDCFLSYAQTFHANRKMNDNSGNNKDCGETLVADWRFAKNKEGIYYIHLQSPQISELMNIEADEKYFKLIQLSDSLIQWQFYHKQFSSKETLITDFYVPIGTKVDERDFHW